MSDFKIKKLNGHFAMIFEHGTIRKLPEEDLDLLFESCKDSETLIVALYQLVLPEMEEFDEDIIKVKGFPAVNAHMNEYLRERFEMFDLENHKSQIEAGYTPGGLWGHYRFSGGAKYVDNFQVELAGVKIIMKRNPYEED